jgi:hypothetical protein
VRSWLMQPDATSPAIPAIIHITRPEIVFIECLNKPIDLLKSSFIREAG